jgi:hypothetical protein
MPKVINLSEDDWLYIFEHIEPKNPLIFIELYNSKALSYKSKPWHPSLSFNKIIHFLSNFSERTIIEETSYDYSIWNNFLTTYKKRNTIIYNLDYTQSNKIYEFFNVLNQNTYEPFDTNEL